MSAVFFFSFNVSEEVHAASIEPKANSIHCSFITKLKSVPMDKLILFNGISLSFDADAKCFLKAIFHFLFFRGNLRLRLLVCLGLGFFSLAPARDAARYSAYRRPLACIT